VGEEDGPRGPARLVAQEIGKALRRNGSRA
jgi:hypothetical protein